MLPALAGRSWSASLPQISCLFWQPPYLPRPRRTLHCFPAYTFRIRPSSSPPVIPSLVFGHSSCRHVRAVASSIPLRSTPTRSSHTTAPQHKADEFGLMCALLRGGAKTTRIAHAIWERTVRPGDIVVDATCGNGNDTLALARLALAGQPADGTNDHPERTLVIALDIQAQALEATQSKLMAEFSPAQMKHVKLVETCHSRLGDIVPPACARLVSFNLGYLPGGNKNVVTNASSTTAALEAATAAVAPGGLISIVAYVGHPEGRAEYDAVSSFAESLPSDEWVCSHHQWANRRQAPSLFLLYKKGGLE